MLAIVQAEVTPFGSFSFYDRDAISKGLKIEVDQWQGPQDGKTSRRGPG